MDERVDPQPGRMEAAEEQTQPRLQITARGFDLRPDEREAVLRDFERLERHLSRVPSESLFLDVVIWHEGKRPDYAGSVRLTTPQGTFLATRNTGPTVHAWLQQAIHDLEEQYDRHAGGRDRDTMRRP
jgi:ribosome-associated translation inhibitor RaiA